MILWIPQTLGNSLMSKDELLSQSYGKQYLQVLKCTKHKHEETLHINLTLNALESILKVGLPGILNLQAKSIDKWATTLIDCLNQSVKPAKFYARRNLLLWGML